MVAIIVYFFSHVNIAAEADCCDEDLKEDGVCFNIDVTLDRFFQGKTDCLPFSRSEAICQEGGREQINLLTAFVDGSNVYGSDEHTAEGLRTKTNGLLRTHELGPTLPTRQDAEFESDEHQNPQDLVAGDIRATETPGLAGLHSLFVAEHNRIAQELKRKDPELGDEDLYQISRRVVGAELQTIVYSEVGFFLVFLHCSGPFKNKKLVEIARLFPSYFFIKAVIKENSINCP